MKKAIIGIIILIAIIAGAVGVKFLLDSRQPDTITVYGAVGGGKENFLADEEVNRILAEKYGITVVGDSWSNGKLIVDPVVREDGGAYDFIFFSDQRFFDYYKLSPDSQKGEAPRSRVEKGGLTLNTPIVIYSWDIVCDALIAQNIVTERDGVYYITDMTKLLSYISQGKTWADIGVDKLYGTINIDSTDPVTSSPGATYYGLLAAIMNGGVVTDENFDEVLPQLKNFYIKSGYMNNTPADLFEMYLKTGVGAKPMIVDYEKSIIDFANSNPAGWAQVKDKVRILYPEPTIWNSHCIASLTENGNRYFDAISTDPDIQAIAWEKYGFRTGVTGGSYDVKKIAVDGLPASIDSVVQPLRMNMYENLMNHLRN